MDFQRIVIAVVFCTFLNTAFAEGTLEFVEADRSLCLQAGLISRENAADHKEKWLGYWDRFKLGRLVKMNQCDASSQQEWYLDGEHLKGYGGVLGVLKIKHKIIPVVRPYSGNHHFFPLRYQGGKMVFKKEGLRYCFKPEGSHHFTSKPLDQCVLQQNSGVWLFGQPPEPGEEGLQGLEGVDQDQDGVRDDVQRYIETTLPDNKEDRMAARQFAAVQQQSLRHSNDKSIVLSMEPELSAAIDCISHTLGGESTVYLRKLEAKIYNTEERLNAWNKLNSYFSGMTFVLPDDLSSQCHFNNR
ncbi:hypothetical protein [Endozoicomonas sp. ONNA1]|uniref:hypothetical protein n=1 Tax=Endozoicomonas sp. ONNA1 TaxID=2828740 RepID=UPI0021474F70|nr:hypothetical protein [Endozoicomonas sp. ONNA1]